MNVDLTGKTILVTGASRGIGRALAEGLAGAGATVAAHFNQSRSKTEALVDALGHDARAFQADLAEPAACARLFAAVVETYGRLDVLVNNAGMLEQQMRLEQMDAARWTRVLGANVIGSFLCAREAIKRMSTQHGGQGGSIINLSSIAARLGAPGEYIDYAAAKGAIDSMTVGLAREVAGEGIRVNAVRPGVIDTEIHASGGEPDRIERVKVSVPMGRGGKAEEVAEAILWLASEHASYTTGALLDVSGGR